MPMVDEFVHTPEYGVQTEDGMCFHVTRYWERIASMMSKAHYPKFKGMHAFWWKTVNSMAAFSIPEAENFLYGCPLMRKNDKAVENYGTGQKQKQKKI